MKKFIVAALLSLVTTVSVANTQSFGTFLDLMKVYDPVYRIDDNCSAVVVSSFRNKEGEAETELITAKHCVEGKSNGFMTTFTANQKTGQYESRTEVYYTVQKKSSSDDLALIKLADTINLYPTVTIAEEIVAKIGDPVITIGFPFIKSKIATAGVYNGIVNDPKDEENIRSPNRVIASSPAISPGNSGGGLFQFNSEQMRYELIGITSFVRANHNHLGFYEGLDSIKKFLGD